MLIQERDLPAALQSFQTALAIRSRLATADPSNAQWQRDLSVSHNKIGDLLVELGNFQVALVAFKTSLAIAERLASTDPSNVEWQSDLAISRDRVTSTEAQQHLIEERHLEEANRRQTQELSNIERSRSANILNDEERARQEEAKHIAEAAARKADEEAEVKRAEQARIAAAIVAAEEAARREAEADKSKLEDPQRIASSVLNAEERATFVKRIQEVLKQSRCYEGAINGSSDDAQKSLDRYIKSVRLQGKNRPVHIELAKASAGDFDSWLKEADDIKGGLCSPPREKRPTASKPQHHEEPRRAHAVEPRARPSSGGGGGGGGGGRIGPIQGIQ